MVTKVVTIWGTKGRKEKKVGPYIGIMTLPHHPHPHAPFPMYPTPFPISPTPFPTPLHPIPIHPTPSPPSPCTPPPSPCSPSPCTPLPSPCTPSPSTPPPSCQDLAGSWYAQCEHGDCECKGSVVWWFRGSEEGVVAQKRQKLRGNYLDCK